MVAGDQIGAAKGQHERRRVERLFVGGRARPAAPMPAGVSDQRQTIVDEAGLFQEREALLRNVAAGGVLCDREGAPERERDQRVVVRQRRLEPAPAVHRGPSFLPHALHQLQHVIAF